MIFIICIFICIICDFRTVYYKALCYLYWQSIYTNKVIIIIIIIRDTQILSRREHNTRNMA